MNDDLFINNNKKEEIDNNLNSQILEKNNFKNSEKNLYKKFSKMSFEESLLRLDNIVEILSSQKNNLEEMIQLYEEATILKDLCEKRLSEAKMKIEHINKKTNND